MNVYRPLPDKPEFSVFEYPGYREYRVENPQPSYRGLSSLTWLVIPTFLSVSWQFVRELHSPVVCNKKLTHGFPQVSWKLRYVILLTFLALIVKQRFLRVQYGMCVSEMNPSTLCTFS